MCVDTRRFVCVSVLISEILKMCTGGYSTPNHCHHISRWDQGRGLRLLRHA